MAANKDNTPENAMDYPEHEKTYELFLDMSKWTIAFCIALLVAMMFGFFGGGGFWGGTILMIILMAVSWFLLSNKIL